MMVNIDADLINADWPKRTPDTIAVLKFDPNQQRDRFGRWTEIGTVLLASGKLIGVVKPQRARHDRLVPLNVLAFDAQFQKEPGFYIGPGGTGGSIGTRYAQFGKYVETHDAVEAAEVVVREDGQVGFINGRHRYAWLRDQGAAILPVAMTPQSVANAKKHGYLAAVKMAWDESRHVVQSVAKQEHAYGNTQIHISSHSSAAASLNAARNAIRDEHLMAAGKDVSPNHVTVRYGLLNDDLDRLRGYIASQLPFEAQLGEIELFDASEHSDGAVPVVARIISPELRAIEAEIGKYADFKDKNFPTYKPHCTLAYVKPAVAEWYAGLFVHGTFIVQSITISHQSGVQETIPFGMAQKWDEGKHRRQPKGSSRGGEFVATLHGPDDALHSLLGGERDVSIQAGDVRRFLELAGEQHEDPDLTDLQVEGMEIFGGNGLGIERSDMPQIPREHRQRFLEYMAKNGVKITEESVDPLTLKPTQNQISARRVAEKLAKYEKGMKAFPPVLTSQESRILDGHHHWGMMAAFRLEFPDAKMPIFRLQTSTKKALALMHAYMKKHDLKRASISGEVQKADPTGRYVTPFVSFDKQGDEQLRMIASLNSSRLATWGFTAEAEVLGMARYRLSAVLDGRTSRFCRLMHGKIFSVSDAREKVIEVLNVQDPNDLKTVQPWPRQTKAALAEYATMSNEELMAAGLHIPPYHPHCRTLLRHVPSSVGKAKEEPIPLIPNAADVFQPVTEADLKELGVEATPEQVAQWNEHIGMTPVELISKLTSVLPQEILTKGKGVGTKPVRFEADTIGIKTHATTPSGVEFRLGAILDPFTGTYYLSEAELLAGTPKAELAFMKNLFRELINTGLKTSADSVAVGVKGNAAYYAKLGFLPDDLEWDSIRKSTVPKLAPGGPLHPMMSSLPDDVQWLVRELLEDRASSALSALVDLPDEFDGQTVGEWILSDIGGTWGLDLTNQSVINQALAYLTS